MLKLLKKVFGTHQSRVLNKYQKIVTLVNLEESKLQNLTDDQIRNKTLEFKERYKTGETLNQILPEAFAVIKNVCRRLVGTEIHVSGYDQKWDMVPYDVQILGAIVLHFGNVSEMQTGEGKTLTALMPLYLNAITEKPVHLVTVNDYLAKRDCEWVGSVLRWLGLSCSALTEDVEVNERREIYKSDVVYGTASQFGFDYLKDNSMATAKNEQVQRGYYYAIVDEIDSILIDEARTPLIISGPSSSTKQLYHSLKDGVSVIVKMQRDFCNKIASEAKRLIDESSYQLRSESPLDKLSKDQKALIDLAMQKFWIVFKGTPKNKLLKRVLEDPDLRTKLDQIDVLYSSDQNAKEKQNILSELFIIIDERANEYELTDKGIASWEKYTEEGSSNDFLMLDLGPLYADIEDNEEFSNEDKLNKKMELQEEDSSRKERAHNLRQLLRSHLLMEKDVDYIIQNNAIVIIDENTGRPQPGRRFSDGLHQAIEAKENVEIQKETQTYATVTLQNYFRMYDKLAGMTGTAITEANEFKEVYKVDVLQIPTHVKCIRADSHDEIYMTEREKYQAIIKEIVQVHSMGRPILIGTESVEISEKLARILKVNKLPHTVLNAKHHESEAEIISKAGRAGAITIATNMAGRGTDIKLSDGVASTGGLHVLATSRHESRRIDRQLIGRCARQGDPGSSKFFVCFEDQLMRRFASPKLNALIKRFRPPEGESISAGMLNRTIETAQKRVEQNNYTIRKYTIEYDDVINKQRQEIYRFRNEVLETNVAGEIIQDILGNVIHNQVQTYYTQKSSKNSWNIEGLKDWLITHFPVNFSTDELQEEGVKPEQIIKHILEKVGTLLSEKLNQLHQKTHLLLSENSTESPSDIVNQSLRNLLIRSIDKFWQEHLLTLDHLRSEVSIRSVGQKDPLMEFKQESFEAFEEMIHFLDQEITTSIFKIEIASPQISHSLQEMLDNLNFEKDTSYAPIEEASKAVEVESKSAPVIAEPKAGRNEPCACGSGKKYKKCCSKEVV